MERLMMYQFHRNVEQGSYGSAFMNRAFAVSILLSMVLLSLGCGAKQIDLIPSRKEPLPSGEVISIKERGGATAYQLKISHLLPPSQLDEHATVYIVWATSSQNRAVEKLT